MADVRTNLERVRTYKIQVPDQAIERLNAKLALAHFPPCVEDNNSWARGPPVREIQRLAQVWQTDFSWRNIEKELNLLPHFLAQIEVSGFEAPFNIHHIHMRSNNPDAIPLLFLHGWPGSFLEVTKMLDGLTQGGDVTFHVVAPSLLDCGFSSRTDISFELQHHAEAYDALMKTLGYQKYVVQAGDNGWLISRYLARSFPASCMAVHTNTVFPTEPTKEQHPELFERLQACPPNQAELEGLTRRGEYMKSGLAYVHQMSSKPLTLGFSLMDSPIGLLAWLYEKMHTWVDDYPWTDIEILTWVSVHYFSTAGPDAASNIYYKMTHTSSGEPTMAAAAAYINVPLGVTRFDGDSVLFPKLWSHTLGPVVFEGVHKRGGHFGAWEQPDAIVADLKSMFKETTFMQ